MKKDRRIILQESILMLEELKKFHKDEPPCCYMVNMAIKCIHSIKVLEEDHNFDKKYLGIK